jgi:hypothetical protein
MTVKLFILLNIVIDIKIGKKIKILLRDNDSMVEVIVVVIMKEIYFLKLKIKIYTINYL